MGTKHTSCRTHTGVADAFDDVRDFHRAAELPSSTTPRLLEPEIVQLRIRLTKEETLKELLPALERLLGEDATIDDLAPVADGIADSIFVLLGTADTFGIPIAEIWQRVHETNMAKVRDGVIRRADGKILKPEGWQPPDVIGAIRDAMNNARK
jgi:predicted HAD superfamily Cof-like phosphohydrolase